MCKCANDPYQKVTTDRSTLNWHICTLTNLHIVKLSNCQIVVPAARNPSRPLIHLLAAAFREKSLQKYTSFYFNAMRCNLF